MVLDPRIALAGRGIDIQPPDLLRTMLGTAQIREHDTQQQLQQVRLGQLLRDIQQEDQWDQWLGTQGAEGGGVLTSLAQPPGGSISPLNPQVAAGPITQTTLEGAPVAPQYPGPSAQGPAMLPGMPLPQASSAAAAAQPQPSAPVRGLGIDPQAALRAGRQRALPLIEAQRKMEHEDLGRQALKLKQMETGIDFMTQALGVISDQKSLDATRSEVQDVSPYMAQMLPETYDQKAIEALMSRMRLAKQRAQDMKLGMNPIWLRGPGDKTAVGQLSPTGEGVVTQWQGGYTPMQPMMPIDTLTGTQLQPRYGLPGVPGPAVTVPKHVEKASTLRKKGEKLGEEAGELPEKVRQEGETLKQIEQKQALAQEDIDKALALLKTARLPVAGVLGNAISGMYQPGADLNVLLESIRGRLGLEELQHLKASGTTLGQVTEPEHVYLQGTYGSLAQKQDPAQLEQMLRRLKEQLALNQARRREAHLRDQRRLSPNTPPTSEAPRGTYQPQSPTSTFTPRKGQPIEGAQRIPKAQVEELRSHYRNDPAGWERAKQSWRDQGFELEE